MKPGNPGLGRPLPGDLAVLLIGHGSVEAAADLPAFLSNIRRGRPTSDAIVREVTRRWEAIGGSPLPSITRAQATALEARLGVPVAAAGRLWHPYATDVVASLVARGARRVVSLPLAPYSVDIYNATSKQACEASGVACLPAPAWNEEPALIDAFVEVIRGALAMIPSERRSAAHVLLTAHSLPRRVIEAGDRYEAEVNATATAVARALPEGTPGRDGDGETSTLVSSSQRPLHLAFQSAGMDGGDWLGPDLATTFGALGRERVRDVVACAIGFLADHTEILYDLDVEARAIAATHGIELTRAASLNTRPRFIDALEAVARRVAG